MTLPAGPSLEPPAGLSLQLPAGPSLELPAGLAVALDRDVRRLDGGRVLLGGDPGRLVRLRAGAGGDLDRLSAAVPADRPLRVLARTLVDGGLAHPRPGAAQVDDVTVVVPVRDRAV